MWIKQSVRNVFFTSISGITLTNVCCLTHTIGRTCTIVNIVTSSYKVEESRKRRLVSIKYRKQRENKLQRLAVHTITVRGGRIPGGRINEVVNLGNESQCSLGSFGHKKVVLIMWWSYSGSAALHKYSDNWMNFRKVGLTEFLR